MLVDSGATSHFMRAEEQLPITGISTKVVFLPNGETITASHKTELPFPTLSAKARQADVLPGLRQNSLVSVGKLSDAGYTTIFHPKGEGVTVHRQGSLKITPFRKPILQGWRDSNGLWRLSREEQTNQAPIKCGRHERVANVYTLPSIPQTIKYHHASAGFPTKDSWVKAINAGHYISWPGLTAEAARKHFPESVETQKGHMKKQRQNVRSTKQKIHLDSKIDEDTALTQTLTKQNMFVKVINAENTVYSDQTGRFPIQSSKGNRLLMVFYDVDANYIDVDPMRDHKPNSMIKSYQALWNRVTRHRKEKPTMHILDNEASDEFKNEIRKNCNLQLVPPDTHRRNLAERAIQTFKSHFISILAGVDPSFPMNLWDRLLPQAVLTLNLLRQANKTPTMSAYQYVNGPFDYNATPLGPLGCKVQFHESTNRRRTWDPRALTGWYLGTSMEHYRCHKIFCKRTRSERISDTVFFQHQYLTQPSTTPEDQIVKAVGDLTSALRQRLNHKGEEELDVLKQMNEILNNKSSKPSPHNDRSSI